MPEPLKQYDPSKILATFRGVRIRGYMDGTFLVAERNADSFSLHKGASGFGTRVKSNDRSGTVTVTLVQSSRANDELSTLLADDELFGTGVGPLLVKDLNGNTLISAPDAWIRRPPSNEFGDSASGREWVIEADELFMVSGGAS